MTDDVFISYAREDKTFVRQLNEQLQARKRDTWVDWEDIPLTADWWAEVQRGIEAANAFVFIISPDSANSAVCFREIEYAVEHHKRMVPILHRDLSPDDERRLHPSINAHNWIFIRPDTTFETALNDLLVALDTDLSYVREHTALLVRARNWTQRERDPSLLLREQALRDAEAWLAESETKEHGKPTDLHVEYITSSRRAQNRRTRRMWAIGSALGIITALLIISLGLFLRAENERQKADEQRRIADELRVLAQQNAEEAIFQGNRSQAIGISAQARLELFGLWMERGVLLGLEALTTNLPYVPQAEQALAEAVQTSRVRRFFTPSPVATTAIAWSPDGTLFITTGDDKIALVWNMNTGEQVLRLIGHTNRVSGVAWSPDGTRIATASWDGTARVWDATYGTPVQTFADHRDWVNAVAWSPDGTRIATASHDNKARIWDVETGALVHELSGHSGYVYNVAWSPDGAWLISVGQDNYARIWDAANGVEVIAWIAHEGNVTGVTWSAEGHYVVTSSWDETAKVWDVRAALGLDGMGGGLPGIARAVLRFNLTGHGDKVTGVAWSPDDTMILTTSNDRTIRVWDATTGDHLYTLNGHTKAVNDAAWSPGSGYILSVGADQQPRLWDARRGDELMVLGGHESRVNAAVWSPDDTLLVTVSADRTAWVWNAADGMPLLIYRDHSRAVNAAAWSPDGTLIATASDDGTVRIWFAESGTTKVLFEGHGGAVNDVAWSPDGTHIASVCDDGALIIWEAATGEGGMTLVGHTAAVNSVAWSPDNTWVVTADATGRTIVWDAATGVILADFEAHTAPVNAVDVSREGKIVTVSDDGTAKVWRLDTAANNDRSPYETFTITLVATLAGHTDKVHDAVWSPNGARLATVGEDRSARVWDAETGAALFTLNGHTGGVLAVDWLTTGTQLVTASADQTTRTWPAWETTGALIEFAQDCCAVRELTPEEREQFNLTAQE